MLRRSRLLRLCLQNRSLLSSSSSSHQSRCYKATNNRNQRLVRQPSPEEKGSPLEPRSWGNYILPTAVLVIAGVGMLVKYNDERRAVPKGSSQGTSSGMNTNNRPAIGGPLKLFDTENNLVTDSDLRGSWTLMYFGYTSSPDVGPAEVQKMAKAISNLEYEHNIKIKPIFITIDPERDTPDQLRAYLKEFDSRIVGLTGSTAAIRQIAHEYRVYFKRVDEEGQDYLVECSHSMYLLDPNMEIVKCFGVEYDTTDLSDAIVKEVKKAS